MHAGEQVGVDDVGRGAVDNHLLVSRGRIGFPCGNKTRPKIRQVRTHRLRRQRIITAAHAA